MDDSIFKSSWCLRIGLFESFHLNKGLSPQNHHLESRHGQWQSAINSWPLRFVPVLSACWFYDSTPVSWLWILCSFNVFCRTEYALCHLGRYYNSLRVRPYSSDWRSDKSEQVQLSIERDAVKIHLIICPHRHLRFPWKNVQRNKFS